MRASSGSRTPASAGLFEIRCHRCSQFLGESPVPVELVGLVKVRDLRDLIAPPRAAWRCKCGWTNIFVPAEASPLARRSA